MAATIDVILFFTAAGFAVIVVATILVIIGVHQEERRKTFLYDYPPTALALLARRVLGAYVYLLPEREWHYQDDSGEEPPEPERPVGPRAL